jgi:hypothetical protein
MKLLNSIIAYIVRLHIIPMNLILLKERDFKVKMFLVKDIGWLSSVFRSIHIAKSSDAPVPAKILFVNDYLLTQ